ncbi:hypothetical protein K490DRAFT_37196 [Saccharata proteae CBS 121410]|uniref:Uncharacterized protein n=1 Tax=Saccharata proteae CBS 121410 TaxID=1314787 RepID=A0A6A5YCZ1_9PEZI|nr:hypothetical protein K490DRAFT_37196 [Saccharata proteae CBS 121410]
MLRTPVSRAVVRSLKVSQRASINAPACSTQSTSKLCTLGARRPQNPAFASWKPVTGALVRKQNYALTKWDKVDEKAEHEVAEKKLEPHPELVSATSSTHAVFGEVGVKEPEKEEDMMKGMKHDFQTIKDTFSLAEVPRQAYYIGLAGVLPYLATSLSTCICAWEINHHAVHGIGAVLSARQAELLLHFLEPLQVGYGAVILSFLGAIHWGLEFAGYGGYQGYRRYAIGVVAPAVAWPTILLPVEYALVTQFLAFNFLYYADSRATVRGWTPSWYGTYRFVLTFIVGASIVASLIGRGQIVDKVGKLPNPVDRVRQFSEDAEEALGHEEAARRAAIVKRDTEGGGNPSIAKDPEIRGL